MASTPSALEFNGIARFGALDTRASIRAMESFTFMAWVKVGAKSTTKGHRAYTEAKGGGFGGSGIRFALTPYTGKLRFELAVKDGEQDTHYDYTYKWDDYWHHVAFVGRTTGETPTYSIILDGIEVATGTLVRQEQDEADENKGISDTAPTTISVGGKQTPTDTYNLGWDGKLDEVLLFNEAKSTSDIVTYIQSDDVWDMSDESMVSYWRFDENGGTSTTNAKESTWKGNFYSGGGLFAGIWTSDRPFIGNGAKDTTKPSTPTLPSGATSAITSDGFTAKWNASTDNVYVQFYEFQYSEFSSFTSYITEDVGQALTKTVRGVSPSVNYYWRVRAYDAELNTSNYSAVQALTTASTGDVVPPSPPTSLYADSVAHTSFNLKWTASTSSDRAGYKLDIATDPEFQNFLSDYRGRELANVTSYVALGMQPITSYYIRLRTFDTSQNESANSVVYRLQTAPLPDLNPPLPVLPEEATSVSSRGFTANWTEGVDDTRVMGYYVDVASDPSFSIYEQTETRYWKNADVGNVLSTRVEGLLPDTLYYYRVRAYDTAHNVSEDAEEIATVQTAPPSIEEGGYLTTTNEPVVNYFVSSDAVSTINTGEDGLLRVLNTTVDKEAYVFFDISATLGTIKTAMLRLYVVTPSTGMINIFAADTATTPQPWSTKPIIEGVSISSGVLNANSWVDVDVSTLLNSGSGPYTFRITTTSTTEITLASSFATERPQLVVESDPTTATQVERIVISDAPYVRRNYVRNPSFEAGTLTGWTGSLANGTITTGADAFNGSKYLRMLTVGANGFYRTTHTDTPAALGQAWSAGIAIRGTVPNSLVYLDLVEYDSASTLLRVQSSEVIYAQPLSWQYCTFSAYMLEPNTAYVSFRVRVAVTGVAIDVDAAIIEKNYSAPTYFDGTTSGALWVGAVNNSASTIVGAELDVRSFYIGDANGNNKIQLMWKRPDDDEWIYTPRYTLTQDRVTKAVLSTLPASFGVYNLVLNPSAEIDTNYWAAYGGATMSRSTERVDRTEYVFEFTPSDQLRSGIESSGMAVSNTAYKTYTARARVLAPVGITFWLELTGYDATGAVTAQNINEFLYGTDYFQDIFVTQLMPPTTRILRLRISSAPTAGESVYVDTIQLQPSDYVQPYRDGSHADAYWLGTPHASPSGLMLRPDTEYSIAHEYEDFEGFFNGATDDTFLIGTEYTTHVAPDDVLTVYPIVTIPSLNSLLVEIPYTGDDNENATAEIRYHRTDQSTWQDVRCVFDRPNKKVLASISNLAPGTSYTIFALFADPDGMYNTVEGSVETIASTLLEAGSPDGPARVTFGGFVLLGNGENDHISVTSHNAFGFADRNVQVEDLPRIHGAVELDSLWKKRSISMSGVIDADSYGALADVLESLKRALALPRQRLVIDTLSNKRRYYTATCSSLRVSQTGGENFTHLIWDAEFLCSDPFAYDAIEMEQPAVTSPNNGTLTLANNGDLEAEPVITLQTTSASAITPTVVNQTTGDRLIPKTTIVRGDTIIINTKQRSVTKNGVEIDYYGGFITMATGGNTFKFELASSGANPTVTFAIRWRNRYI